MASGFTKASKRQTIATERLLAEHFDDKAGRYREGWDDAHIAKVVSETTGRVVGRGSVVTHRHDTDRNIVRPKSVGRLPNAGSVTLRVDRLELVMSRLCTLLGEEFKDLAKADPAEPKPRGDLLDVAAQ